MTSDYVDVIHLTQFRVQSEAAVKTAIKHKSLTIGERL